MISMSAMLIHSLIFSLLISLAESSTCNISATSETIKRILRYYDTFVRPYELRGPVKVEIELHVQQISALSESLSQFEVETFYSEMWSDERMQFLPDSVCRSNISLDVDAVEDLIWTPNIACINCKAAIAHVSPGRNTFLIVYHHGLLWLNNRMKLRGPCTFDLPRFPLDEAVCSLQFSSVLYSDNQIDLQWFDAFPITIIEPPELPDFTFSGWSLHSHNISTPHGIWVRLEVEFIFSRKYGFYFLTAYIPTTVAVVTSWVSFTLEPRAVSARMTLGVSAFLAISFQFGNLNQHLPRVSALKCIDYWLMSCFVFIFLTLVELTVVSQRAQQARRKSLAITAISIFRSSKHDQRRAKEELYKKESYWLQIAKLMSLDQLQYISAGDCDKIAIYVFPAVFVAFSAAYWSYFLFLIERKVRTVEFSPS